MVELLKHVHGLVNAPRKRYEVLTDYIQDELGGKKSALDPAVFLWHDEAGKLTGIMMIHVDDVACGGTDAWQKAVMEPLRQKFPFGSWQLRKGKYCGRQLEQMGDGSITISLELSVEKMKPIILSAKRREQIEENCTPEEIGGKASHSSFCTQLPVFRSGEWEQICYLLFYLFRQKSVFFFLVLKMGMAGFEMTPCKYLLC